MLTTNELRWFHPGTLPSDILVWFQQNCLIDQLQPPEVREDVYLYAPGSDFLGIKLRQGKLEVKWRKAELGIVDFGKLVAGKAETWAKCSCSDSTGEIFQPATVLGNAAWVSVRKVLYLQLYRVLPDFSLIPLTNHENINNGCSVEITQLIVQNSPWWSLALEANGDDVRLMANLQATVNSVFNTYQSVELQVANSYAYPHWLGLIKSPNAQ
ncbi:hypothetical protein H6G36_14810 [Anabaena minutissima FACHB-250]|nr:hypothetical protein [Anabaena minutissima FACHB-250]